MATNRRSTGPDFPARHLKRIHNFVHLCLNGEKVNDLRDRGAESASQTAHGLLVHDISAASGEAQVLCWWLESNGI